MILLRICANTSKLNLYAIKTTQDLEKGKGYWWNIYDCYLRKQIMENNEITGSSFQNPQYSFYGKEYDLAEFFNEEAIKEQVKNFKDFLFKEHSIELKEQDEDE
jgi:hypothetical protein